MHTSNSSIDPLFLEKERGWMVVAAVSIGASSVIGAVGNLMIIISVFLVKDLRTCGNIFVVNLAMADLLITLFIDPFNVVGIIAGRQVLMANPTLCEFIASFCGPACMSSMWNMFAISFNRYILICKPHLYRQLFTVRHSVMMCASIWIFAHLVHFPTLFGWAGNGFDQDYYICTVGLLTHSYAIFYMSMGVPVPLLGIVFCYTKIFLTVRRVKGQILKHKNSVRVVSGDATPKSLSPPTSRRTTTKTPCQSDENSLLVRDSSILRKTRSTASTVGRTKKIRFTEDDIKLAKTLFAAFFVFLVCWSPFVLFVLANQPAIIPKWMYVLAIILAHTNAAVNPILYGLTNQRFREGYVTLCSANQRAFQKSKFRFDGNFSVIIPEKPDQVSAV